MSMDIAKRLQEKLQQRHERFKQKKTSYKRPIRFEEGKTKFKILPSWRSDDETFYRDYGEHWIKDPETGKAVTSVPDVSIINGEPCPVRAALMKMMAISDEKGRKLIKDSLAKNVVIVNAIIFGHNDYPEDEPQLLQLSETQFDNICTMAQEYFEVGRNPFELSDQGVTWICHREGSGLNSNYLFSAAPVSKALDESVMNKVTNIDEWIESKLAEDTAEAMSALNSYRQSSLFGDDIAGELTTPSGRKAITTASNVLDDQPDDIDDIEDIEEAEVVRKEPKTKSPPESMSDGELADILSDLD